MSGKQKAILMDHHIYEQVWTDLNGEVVLGMLGKQKATLMDHHIYEYATNFQLKQLKDIGSDT